jgi:hypothetical protein
MLPPSYFVTWIQHRFKLKWRIFVVLHVLIQSSNILNCIYWIQYPFGHNGNDCNNYNSYGLDNLSYYFISSYNVPFFEKHLKCL